jgi:hypothetical protein
LAAREIDALSFTEQTPSFVWPHPNALQEKFHWWIGITTSFSVKPFNEHIEGLSRFGEGN